MAVLLRHINCRKYYYYYFTAVSKVQLALYCIIHFYGAFHSRSLSEALPTTAIHTAVVYTSKRYRQLRVKDLPKVPTWRLEHDSNLRPSGRKASTLPMRHHAQHHREPVSLSNGS